MIPDFLPKLLSSEAMKHPLFVICCIVSLGFGAGSIFNPFVLADDFTTFQVRANDRLGKLEIAVCTVQFTTERNGLESQVRAVSTEIFQLERIIAASEGSPRDVKRLDDLKTDLGQLERALDLLLNSTHCADPDAR